MLVFRSTGEYNLAGVDENLMYSCCPGWVDTDMGLQMGKPPKSLGKSIRTLRDIPADSIIRGWREDPLEIGGR